MSWLQKLYETYEVCVQNPDFVDPPQDDGKKEVQGLMPISHASQQAHIEVTLDNEGKFIRSEILPAKTQIIIPATEDSASRSSNVAPHPLMDNISYCASDYKTRSPLWDGKDQKADDDSKKTEKKEPQKDRHEEYMKLLQAWCDSPHTHPHAEAVLIYLKKGTLIEKLTENGIVLLDDKGKMLTSPPEGRQKTLLNLLPPDSKTKMRDQGKALIRWVVQRPGELEPRTWKNKSLQEAWAAYDAAQMQQKGLCMVSGTEISITTKHPRNIRRPGDGAKLISSNDETGFTFRGRFLMAEEACTVGYEVSHKAHNALRWLIARQGYHNGNQAVVAWAVKGVDVPNPSDWLPMEEIDFYADDEDVTPQQTQSEQTETAHKDIGQTFSRCLAKVLCGYKANLDDKDGIAVLALDAANPSGKGRLAVTFYRAQIAHEYLEKLKQWQEDVAWVLPLKKQDEQDAKAKPRIVFTPYAPLPSTIAGVAYGRRVDDKLLKATVERLLPCIVDGSPIPRDLMESCVRRACNKVGLEKWESDEEVLGVACALYRGFYARHPEKQKRRSYTMTLDKERRTRDYLYGRLLAVAEYIERSALKLAGENRPTNAERLMQRFADHPCSTWRDLEKQLAPYMQRLQSRDESHWVYDRAKRVLQEVFDAVNDIDDFTSSKKLDGEFLLGYHCQYSDFFRKESKK